MTATTVPITSEPMADRTVRKIVILKAPRMSNWVNSSAIGCLSVGRTPGTPPARGERTAYRRGVGQEQASGLGGLPAPGLKPDGPRLVVTKFCQEPSAIIFFRASVILVHRAVSPFFRPMP